MYSSGRAAVNRRGKHRAGPALRLGVGACACLLVLLSGGWAQPQPPESHLVLPERSCDARLTALFTPARPQLGRYEVCSTPEPLASIVPAGWLVERVPPLDGLGAAGSYDRWAVRRLYGGRPAAVARGWIEENGVFEAITLISPHPDATVTQLMEGTMVIRHIICCT